MAIVGVGEKPTDAHTPLGKLWKADMCGGRNKFTAHVNCDVRPRLRKGIN